MQTLLSSEKLILDLALISTVEQPNSVVQPLSLLGYMCGLDPDPNPQPCLGPPYTARRLKMLGLIFKFSIALTHRAPPNRKHVEAPGQLLHVSECVDSTGVVGTEDMAVFGEATAKVFTPRQRLPRGSKNKEESGLLSPCHFTQLWHCRPPCQALHPGGD